MVLAEDVMRPRSGRVVLNKGAKIGPAQVGLLREVYSELPNAKVAVELPDGETQMVAVWTHEPNENLIGRYLGAPIADESTGEVLFEQGTPIELHTRDEILGFFSRGSQADPMVPVRSVLKCDAKTGVCQKCYGFALANNAPAEIGDAVGHIAAQSIGEPGTQLTMRTFHTGGVAGADITHGLPRVVELFEARKPKGVARLAEVSGRVEIDDTERGTRLTIVPEDGPPKEYQFARRTRMLVDDGEWVEEGTQITPGSLYPADVLRYAGDTATERYLVNEVQEVYRSQGVEINDKHIELIARQMMKKVRLLTAGDTQFLPGQLVDRAVFKNENERVAAEGGEPAEAEQIILGITKASLATESFLSAASFQETTKVLTDAAIEGKKDTLQGLKENVIIGKLIPAGTGLRRYRTLDIKSAGGSVDADATAWFTGESEEDYES
jgi:DNA-directed RNA polymerase subunit beta'